MLLITLTHPNDEPVLLNVDAYFYHYKNPKEDYTSVVTHTGAKVLVSESVEMVSSKLRGVELPLATLTHPNLKCEITFTPKVYFYSYYSKNHQATHVVAFGGAYFPAAEVSEIVKKHMEGAA